MRESFAGNLARRAAFGAARAIDGAGRLLGRPPVSFEREKLEREAARKLKLEDFGDPYYRKGLERLTASLEADAKLHLIGRLFLRGAILNALQNRLLLHDHLRHAPQLFAGKLKPPIVITGLPRSGTTLLHRLLGRNPDFFAPPYWLLIRPLPRKPGEPDMVRLLRAQRELAWWRTVTPRLREKHLISARRAEECIYALGLTFETVLWWGLAPVESYLAWYGSTDRREKYRDYRSILLALQAHRPRQRLVLKAPDHLGGLDALLDAVPEAMVVQLHRDPVEVANSLASLVASGHAGFSEAPDAKRSAAANLAYLEAELKRNLQQRRSLRQPILDVRYTALLADPLRAAERTLEDLGLRFKPLGRRHAEQYLAKHAQGRHGRHEYKGAEFGLEDEETAARFRFYTEAFGPWR